MNPETQHEIQQVELQTRDIISTANAVTVASDNDVARAAIILKDLATAKKAVESKRQEVVKPINDHVKWLNDQFRAITEPIDTADKTIRGKVSAYRAEQAEAARIEQQRLDQIAAQEQAALDAEAERKQVDAPVVVAPVVAAQPKSIGNMTTRKTWKFTITDPNAVPREYTVINETAIRQAIGRGVREIPGVNIYQEETIVVL